MFVNIWKGKDETKTRKKSVFPRSFVFGFLMQIEYQVLKDIIPRFFILIFIFFNRVLYF